MPTPGVKRPVHRRKRQLVPRDVLPTEKPNVEAFDAGGEARAIGEGAAEDDLDLADPADAEERQGAVEPDVCPGFLERFALRAFGEGFAMFQVAGGEGPKAAPRLDGAAAEHDLAVMHDDRADDHLWVVVGHPSAGIAHRALVRIVRRDACRERGHGYRVRPCLPAIKRCAEC